MTVLADLRTGPLAGAVDAAARAIPPVWPLAASVAVNPYLGQTGEPLAVAAARLGRVGGIAATMPRDWYAGRIASGEVSEGDLLAAWEAAPEGLRPQDVAALKAAALRPARVVQALPTVAELAARDTGIDWPGRRWRPTSARSSLRLAGGRRSGATSSGRRSWRAGRTTSWRGCWRSGSSGRMR